MPAPRSSRLLARLDQVVEGVGRFMWHVLVPLLVTSVLRRYAVPAEAEAQGTWAESFARIGSGHPVGVAAATFLLLSVLCHYWSPFVFDARPRARVSGTVTLVGIGASAALALGVAYGIRSAFGVYQVDSASMLPTLTPGDFILGRKVGWGSHLVTKSNASLRRGDVVVFARPSGIQGPDRLIKRVIGLPGDRISMNGPHAVINGWEVPSCDAGPYFLPVYQGGITGRLDVEFLGDRAYLVLYSPAPKTWGETYLVRPGEVFVLGDDRSNSSDSRAWNHEKGAGLPFGSLEARIDRWLIGTARDDHLDIGHVSEPLDLFLRLAGLDVSVQADGIQRCLRERPANTEPPRPHAP